MIGRPLAAYLPWQVRESLVRAIIAPVIFLVLVGIPLWAFKNSEPMVSFRDAGAARDFAVNMYRTFFSLATTLGAIIMVNQLPALDRERQYFRFLFANQVAPWMFYLQRFVVAVALFMIGAALIPLGFAAFVTDVPLIGTLVAAGLFALLIGSLMLLCGALTQRDGAALMVVYLGSAILQQTERTAGLPGWLEPVAVALPPFVLAGDLRAAWLTEGAVAATDVLHVVGYSVAMLVAALVAIKRFPLAR